jgi:hypothetical protein
MIHLKNLKGDLHVLQDYEWQRDMWLPPYGDFGIDWTELVCMVFDDTGLQDSLDANTVEAEVGPAAAALLKQLDDAVMQIEDGIDEVELLDDPRMENIRVLARKILAALPES